MSLIRQPPGHRRAWRIGVNWRLPAALGFALATLCAVAMAATLSKPGPGTDSLIGLLSQRAPAGYVGSAACAACHAGEAAAWRRSHHAMAQAAATPETVRGDFNDARIAFKGATGRFYRDGAKYMVETEGSDGKRAAFTVSYTFGVAPLQQYLVTFPDGRLQVLPWAWDTRPAAQGGQRWFHLYQDQPIPPSDPLHWTGRMQNWNFMCAECHTTGLRKRYDATSNRYDTIFAEVSVGCESCHGAGAGHIAWAHSGQGPRSPHDGFATAAARRPAPDWSPNQATGSPAHGVSRPAGDEVELCAHCHSRRGEFAEGWQPGHPLTDTHLPTFLDAGLFEDDGQMKDEVFNDQAFKQSLMYARGVVCSDCHDPHAGGLRAAGVEVCAQCHQSSHFATVEHTGHAPGPGAPGCIECHMPARTYMVVDRRHDHSFRIPRPDLSVRFNTPNACNDCHTDKSAAWAAAAVERWHGPTREGHQTWTEAVHEARDGDPDARAKLIALADDTTVPAIARATVLTELQRFPSRAADAADAAALGDADPLVRIAGLRAQADAPPDTRWQRASPLLSDPLAAVRIEAASVLADQATASLSAADAARLAAACAEYEAAQRLNADRPEGRANLGEFLRRRGHTQEAEAEFRAGLKLDANAIPLYVDLADLYRSENREDDATALLREAIQRVPDAAAPHHALGLSLIRQKDYAGALEQLRDANNLAPDEPRYAYVYAVALQSTGKADDARRVICAGLAHAQNDAGLLTLALQDALNSNDRARASQLASNLQAVTPDDPAISRLVATLRGG
jgi:tetratricopeptide (TPR) repeat protein